MDNKQVVLIVEDDAINRDLLKELLIGHYTVMEAENGAEAWDMIRKQRNHIAAVLLDIIMPIMDGYQLLDKIREEHMEELPVIVMTGSADEETEQRALEIGAWDFVTKPYNPRILYSRLRNAIARSQISVYEKMKYMSEHDELTGLYNRSKMFTETRKMLDENPNKHFAFTRIDVDRFALFNTSFGEQEGDRLLKYMAENAREIAAKLSDCKYGRINADVFCACFSYEGNMDRLEQMVLGIQRRVEAYRSDYRLEVSIGICKIDDFSLSIEEYFFRASVAAAKCKNQIETYLTFYDDSMGDKLANEVAITNEMQTALDQEQFVVYLQPKVTVSTECVCGAEALVRWIHPQKGLVSPGAFIPVFEKNGFISKLDYYVWERTCRLLRDWQEAGKSPFPVSVNISRISLYNPQLADMMKRLVKKYHISPALLQLEVTESAYMSNPGLLESTIADLREAGFTILMDDFGSGYSSLNTLKKIRMDVLKVDMKFLPVGDETERAEIVLISVIKMAKWLGMSVVVEGVETRKQRDFLEGVGCDYIQGYYYSKPIPSAEYEEQYLNKKDDTERNPSDENNDIVPQYNMTILVIDDSEIDRAVLQENFQELYHLKMCESAEEGLAYLQRNAKIVRLILVDNLMPGMGGMEFLRFCQQDDVLSCIPKIMITADDTVEDQVRAFQEGAYDYITKPFVREVVVARINHIMDIGHRTSIFDKDEQEYLKQTEREETTG